MMHPIDTHRERTNSFVAATFGKSNEHVLWPQVGTGVKEISQEHAELSSPSEIKPLVTAEVKPRTHRVQTSATFSMIRLISAFSRVRSSMWRIHSKPEIACTIHPRRVLHIHGNIDHRWRKWRQSDCCCCRRRKNGRAVLKYLNLGVSCRNWQSSWWVLSAVATRKVGIKKGHRLFFAFGIPPST